MTTEVSDHCRYFVTRSILAAGISVCQMNTELHGPLGWYRYSSTRFDRLMADMVERSDFLPLQMKRSGNHLRAAWINVRDPRCLRRYLDPLLRPHLCPGVL